MGGFRNDFKTISDMLTQIQVHKLFKVGFAWIRSEDIYHLHLTSLGCINSPRRDKQEGDSSCSCTVHVRNMEISPV